MATAVIVDEAGRAFVGWRRHCSLSEFGVETYSSVPFFARETVLLYSATCLWPAGEPKDRPLRLNRPYVFSSERSALRAARRMWGRVAVVS